DSPDGKPVTDLEVVHEKLLHLLIVSDDLSWFAHEHPAIQPDASFTLKLAFPHGGDFTLFHDFTPARVGMQVVPVDLHVEGDVPAPTPLVANATRSEVVDGFTVELDAPSPLRSIQMQRLTFRLSKGGVPVTDLEPFLGAMGHLIVVSEDRKRFVHSHPLELKTPAGKRPSGPDVTFQAQFPVPGLYKAWAQFQHHGRVITAPFVVKVVSPRDLLPAAPPK
ncbi:MAG TPA: hypothetical protein VKE69_01940, partial [Planctomycetota bacterium]|nr:hypothetical protein [Planctomycetota bacterium]